MRPTIDTDAVLFDVDETLFDRRLAQRLVLRRMRDALPELFAQLGPDALEAAWLRSDRETENHVYTTSDIRASRNLRSALFLRLLGLPEEAADRVTDFYVQTYPGVSAPMDGATEVVAACAARLPVGIISNAFPDVQYRKLDSLGIRPHLACVVLSEEFGVRKPDPAVFLHTCGLLDVAPARCVYVGDSFTNDVAGARAAGLVSCWLNPRRVATPEGQAAADLEVASLRELPGILFG